MTDTDHRLPLRPSASHNIYFARGEILPKENDSPCPFPNQVAKSCGMALPALPSVLSTTICTPSHIIGKSIECAQAELVRKDAYQIAAIGHESRSNMALAMLRPSTSASANLDNEARGRMLTQARHPTFSRKSLQLTGLATPAQTPHPKAAMLAPLCRTMTSFNGIWRALASS